MKPIRRRDFLKLAAMATGALITGESTAGLVSEKDAIDVPPNIIVVVFDALSARNMSLYGYSRNTTPNLERFAQRAHVYHAHYAGGSFTTPGTASLLTGTYPWTHRAINMFGLIERNRASNNLFSALGPGYERLAFSQNLLPNFMLEQFSQEIDTILSPASFSSAQFQFGYDFDHDRINSYRAQEFLAPQHPEVLTHSLVFGSTINYLLERAATSHDKDIFPLDRPQVLNGAFFFSLQDVMSGMESMMRKADQPFLHYYHLMAPHSPYRPDHNFYRRYDNDDFVLVDKPRSKLDAGYKQVRLDEDRNLYDAFVANLDFEFGRLMDQMSESGVFDKSYVVVTSDHGEMFERGVEGHLSRVLYEPGIHIPLLVSTPGQHQRNDIYVPTNSVDLLPTLVHLGNSLPPAWSEGRILPGLGGESDPGRSVFTVEAKSNSAFRPLTKATIAMRKGVHKLIYYTGYETGDFFELYDIQNDPEEINDLFPSDPSIAVHLKEELLETLAEQNRKIKTNMG